MSSVTSALERLPSTNSLKYLSSCQSSIQRVYLALRGNRDACLSFLRRCADYGDEVVSCYRSSTALPTPFRVMASHDLRERTMRPLSETTDISVENVTSVQGLSSYQSMPKWLFLTRMGRLAKVQSRIQEGPIFRRDDNLWVELSTRVLDRGCRWPCLSRQQHSGWSHSGATPRAVGEIKIFCACRIGELEGRTSSAIVLQVCDEAMDDEACILLMIPLFSFCWARARDKFPFPLLVIHDMLLVNNWLFE